MAAGVGDVHGKDLNRWEDIEQASSYWTKRFVGGPARFVKMLAVKWLSVSQLGREILLE